MMRVLYENITAFADKLFVPEVYSAFELLISNAKKSTKPDGMARLEEFETKVTEVRFKCSFGFWISQFNTFYHSYHPKVLFHLF